MKATDARNHKTLRSRSFARALIISGLYALLMGAAVYLTYKLLLDPTRERDFPAIPKRTESAQGILSVMVVLPTLAQTPRCNLSTKKSTNTRTFGEG